VQDAPLRLAREVGASTARRGVRATRGAWLARHARSGMREPYRSVPEPRLPDKRRAARPWAPRGRPSTEPRGRAFTSRRFREVTARGQALTCGSTPASSGPVSQAARSRPHRARLRCGLAAFGSRARRGSLAHALLNAGRARGWRRADRSRPSA
jgi:hypothetical protein